MYRQRSIKLLLIFSTFLFTSCNTTTPDRYFGLAVLNSNMLVGFAEEGLYRDLESPSVKMDDKGAAVPMTRAEMIKDKIAFVDEDVEEINGLKETGDTKEMIQACKALYAYVVPVYKTAYVQLAKLYDEAAPKEKIESETKAIHDKYYAGFKERNDKLIAIGKSYAAKHSIKVNWAE
ncbi:MAG TPA: hypothetical protein VK484_11465 [Ferruginibacter sp.]|nr:hypothetical protein [Ferruginibacter sp.]